MAQRQIHLKNNHFTVKHRASTMRKRNGNKILTSSFAFLLHILHHRDTKTMAFNPLWAMALSRRKCPNSMRQKWRIPRSQPKYLHPPSPFCPVSGYSVGISSSIGYSPCAISSSTCLFSTSKSPNSSSDSPAKTQYTIDDSVCLPTKEETLEKAVHKACRSLEVYMEKKPAAAHTRRAFEILVEMISESKEQSYEGIILDSGCGTGRSTKFLSSSIHPRHLVIGVDRSLARLTKTKDNQQGYDDNNDRNDGTSERAAYCHKASDNAYLVRAELVDFWRCCIERGWTTPISEPQESQSDKDCLKITHHYMLYPNPYPTNARLSSRWYAHPSFPLILKLGIQTMVIRSNWEGYLIEFAKAVEMANEFYATTNNDERKLNNSALTYIDSAKKGPSERIDKSVALTNFESKYDNVGERTFELILERK